jgi:hypothetical protein
MNKKPSLFFFIFWTGLLVILSYDLFSVADKPLTGVVIEKEERHYLRLITYKIIVKSEVGKRYYDIDGDTFNSIKLNDKLRIKQSRILKRTVSIKGPEYRNKTFLSYWNMIFYVFVFVCAIASFGSMFIYLRYLL